MLVALHCNLRAAASRSFIDALHNHGDVLLLLSTSGMSPNLLKAAEAARAVGVTTWALTGDGPNALCEACDDHVAIPGRSANVQEAQLVAVHAICRAFDFEVERQEFLLKGLS